MLDKIFGLTENRTTVKTEFLAGLTTFLTMSYILFLQPAVLSRDFLQNPTGLDPNAVLLATCLASALACLIMGLYARYPIALAPGMGENFFFITVTMALGAQGVTNAWQVALGVVFIAGVLFFLLSVLRVREAILNAVSPTLRNGIAVGIGLFIALIGLQKGGLFIKNPVPGASNWIMLNSHLFGGDALMQWESIQDLSVFVLGLAVAGGLYARRVRGAMLWGILSAALLSLCMGKLKYAGILGLPNIEEPAILRMDIKAALSLTCVPFIIVFLFMDMFDTVGTLVGVAEQAGFMKDNKLPRASRALMADASGTVIGACLGTSTVTSYIESAAGVAAGGRTGLTAVAVACYFLLALLFSPLVITVAEYAPITAPALVIVGSMMMRNARKIDWDDYSESIPAFLIAIGIPLSYSISDGLAIGFLSYPVIKLIGGKGRTVNWLMYGLAVLILAYFVLVRTQIP